MKVGYMWTDRDAQRFSAGYSKSRSGESQLVSPYGHVAHDVADGGKYRPGDLVPLDLEGVAMPGWRDRFTKALLRNNDSGQYFTWEEIPPDLLGATTLGELCRNLHAKRANAYPAFLYDRGELSGAIPKDPANPRLQEDAAYYLKMPQLLFDYWENTAARYAILGGGKFSYSMAPCDIPIDPTQKWRTLTARPKSISVFGTSSKANERTGQQSVVNDNDIDTLLAETYAVRQLAEQTIALVDQAETQLLERARVLTPFAALHVLFRCCGGQGAVTAPDGTQYHQVRNTASLVDCDAVVADIESVLLVAKDRMMHTPMADLTKDSNASALTDPKIKEAARKLMGTNDIAATVGANRSRLWEKLFSSVSSFKAACENVFGTALDRSEVASPRIQAAQFATVEALDIAVQAMLTQTASEADTDRVFKLLEVGRVEPASTRAQITGNSAIELMQAVVGYSTITGPKHPKLEHRALNLSMRLLQAAAFWGVPRAAKLAYEGKYGIDLSKHTSRILALMDRYGYKQMGELRAALELEDAGERARAVRHHQLKFQAHVLRSTQGSIGYRTLDSVFQVLATFTTIAKGFSAASSPEARFEVEVLDALAAGNTVAHWGFQAGSEYLQYVGKFAEYEARLAKMGETCNVVGALIGMLVGALDTMEGIDKALSVDPTKSEGGTAKAIAGGLKTVGSALLALGLSSGSPHCAAIGFAMVFAGEVTSEVSDLIKGNQHESWNGIQPVALGLLARAERAPFFSAIYVDVKADYEALREKIIKGEFPYAPSNPFIVESLRRMGFTEAQIGTVTNAPVSLDPKLMAGRYSTILVPPPKLA
ncbi:MAG: hypothetical protein HOW73_42810 [Polyangiaceae bacterium]|nr:hypothetical protein [Polyangiaceae bacterium]